MSGIKFDKAPEGSRCHNCGATGEDVGTWTLDIAAASSHITNVQCSYCTASPPTPVHPGIYQEDLLDAAGL